MPSSWAVGAVINVAGSILINLGTNVMKLGHNKRAASSDLPDKEKPSVRKFREWQIGVALFAVGNVLNFASFGFAAQSLLAALGSIQFVSNVIFSKLVLGEKANRRVLWATACIVGGCVVLVSFGNHQSQKLTVQDMLHNYRSAVYITYLVLIAISVVFFYMVYRYGKKKMMAVGQSNLSSKWMRILPVSYALFSGMLGTQSVLFSKTLSTLIRTSLQGDSQVGSWFFWFIIMCLLVTAFFWVSRLNKALKLFPAIIIVPTMQISWTLFSIISGGVYFKEYLTFTRLSATMFALGVMIVFAGVYLLTPTQKKELRDLQEQFVRHDSDDDMHDGRPGDMALVDVEQASSALASGAAELRQKAGQRGTSNGEEKEALYIGDLSHASTSALQLPTSSTGPYRIALQRPRGMSPQGRGPSDGGAAGHMGTERSFVEDVLDDFSVAPREGITELLGLSEDRTLCAVSVFGGMPLVELSTGGLDADASSSSVSGAPVPGGPGWVSARNPMYQASQSPDCANREDVGVSTALSPRLTDQETALRQRSLPPVDLASPAARAQLGREHAQHREQAQQAQQPSRPGSRAGSERSSSMHAEAQHTSRQGAQLTSPSTTTAGARLPALALPTSPVTGSSPSPRSRQAGTVPASAPGSLSQSDAAHMASLRRPGSPATSAGDAPAKPHRASESSSERLDGPGERSKSLHGPSVTVLVADSGRWSPSGAVERRSATRSLKDATGLLSPGGLRRVLSPTHRGYDDLGSTDQLEEPLHVHVLGSELDDDG